MASVDVVNLSLEKKGTMNLDDRFFGASVKSGLFHEVVLMQLANRRQGTACTKTRGEVRGGGKKPWRQKGTGRARAGSIRSPLWRGGGTTFGPLPRPYTQELPRQKSRVALYGALSAKLREGALKVVEELLLPESKTRALRAMLKNLRLEGKILILIDNPSIEFRRAARNLSSVTVQDLKDLNVYDILRHHYLLIRRQDLDALQHRFIQRVNGKRELRSQ